MEVIYMAIENIAGTGEYYTAPMTSVQPKDQAKDAKIQGEQVMSNQEAYKSETGTYTGNVQPDTKASENNQNTEEQFEGENALRKAVDSINKQLSHTVCKYGFHDATNRVIIKIVDKDTDKVIKEIPPEKTLEMIAKSWELAGLIVDNKL